MTTEEKAKALDAILDAIEKADSRGLTGAWPIYRQEPVGKAIIAAQMLRRGQCPQCHVDLGRHDHRMSCTHEDDKRREARSGGSGKEGAEC